MSRIGKKPIDIPSGVKVSVEGAEVKVEGKSTLAMPLPPHVSVEVKDGKVYVQQASDDRRANAMHGLTRSLIQNMVTGVTVSFTPCGTSNTIGCENPSDSVSFEPASCAL